MSRLRRPALAAGQWICQAGQEGCVQAPPVWTGREWLVEVVTIKPLGRAFWPVGEVAT